jgi:hypothetical protein
VGAHEIGTVNRDNTLRIEYKGRIVVSAEVPALRNSWADAVEHALKVQ